MNWNWASGCSGGGVCAYPHIAYGTNSPTSAGPGPIQISALNNDTLSFNYTLGGSGVYSVLDDEFLYPTSSGGWPASYEIALYANENSLPAWGFFRPNTLPVSHHMTSPFSADVWFAASSSVPEIFIYPTTTFTDQFQNSTLSGSVAGTPGTDPTGCDFTSNLISGITKTIVGHGSTTASDGTTVDYVDVQLSGTPSSTGYMTLAFSPAWYQGDLATTYPQKWWLQPDLALTAGSLSNVDSITALAVGYNSLYNYYEQMGTADIKSTLTATPQRYGVAYWPSPTVVYVSGNIQVHVTSGKAINITLRIGISQNGAEHGLMGNDPWLPVTNATWDLKAVFADLISAGLITNTQYVNGHQFGAETVSGAGSMNIQTLSATQN